MEEGIEYSRSLVLQCWTGGKSHPRCETVTVKCCKRSQLFSVVNNFRQSHALDNSVSRTNKCLG